MNRALHGHIFQSRRPVEGCVACSSINLDHMDEYYVYIEWLRITQERALCE